MEWINSTFKIIFFFQGIQQSDVVEDLCCCSLVEVLPTVWFLFPSVYQYKSS